MISGAPKGSTQAEVAEYNINMGVTAGVISAAITAGLSLWSLVGDTFMGIDAWSLIDVALIAGLTFGTYKKSRTCAIIMFSYFVFAKILLFIENPQQVGGIGIFITFMFTVGFFRGIVGTFQYHKLIIKNN